MVLTILTSAFITLFLSVYVSISFLSSCVLCSAWERSPRSASTYLCVWVVGVVILRIDLFKLYDYVQFRFLDVLRIRTHLARSLSVLIVLLRSFHMRCEHVSDPFVFSVAQSAREANSTKPARNCSKLSVFLCFPQMKLYLSKAIILVVTKISSSVVISSCVVTLCSSKLGLFCCICLCPSAPKHKNR